jgi:hypothetical protein
VPLLLATTLTCDGGCHSGGDSGMAPEALVSAAHCWCATRARRCCRCARCALESALHAPACNTKQVGVRNGVAPQCFTLLQEPQPVC